MRNLYHTKKQIFILLFSLFLSSVFYGQTGWSLDQTFNKRIAKTDDYFFRISKRTDGKFLFCTNKDQAKLKLMNADGSISTTFEVSITGNIFALTQAIGDKTYVGGNFTNMMGIFAPKIARINADGTRDINFLPETNSQDVYALQELSDGKLLVGRDGSVQRLNADGTTDSSFSSVTTNGIVQSFAILPNGKILAGGLFTTVNGTSKNRIVMLNADGTIDTSFIVGNGFNNDVYIVRVGNDGYYYVGGKFTTYKGTTINRIAKLNNIGTLDTSFHTSNSGFNNDVWTIEFLNDNKPLIGGLFTSYKGISNNSILKLNLDGSVDNSFDTGIAESNGIVYKIIVNSSNDVLVSGTFLKYKNTHTNQAFLANMDGSINSSFHLDERFCVPGISTYLRSPSHITIINRYPTAIQNDGKIILANVYFENKFYIIIRLNADGTKDTTFNFDVSTLPANFTVRDVNKIIVRPNGKIICSALTGRTNAGDQGGVYLKGLFQLNQDGSIDNTFDTGHIHFNITPDYGETGILNFDLQPDGKIVLHCNKPFVYKGFQANAGAIRILTNGNIDLTFQNISGTFEFSYGCVEVMVLPDGKILLYSIDISRVGYGDNPISPYSGGRKTYSLVKLNSDGTLAHRFENLNLLSSWQEIINKVIVDGNSLIITGNFHQINGVPKKSIARIDFDGNLINDLNSPFPASHPFNDSQITDIIKYNNKFYITSFSNLTPANTNFYNLFADCDMTIMRLNLDGTLDTNFSTITLDKSTHVYTTNAYTTYFPFSNYTYRNLHIGFNETNKLIIFGFYNSINNEPFIGLSRVIIDENLSTPYNQFLGSKIKFYPNPTKDKINITTQNESIVQINVYDMFGRLLKFQQGNTNNEQISIHELPNAIYLIEVKTANSSETIKIVKE